VLVDLVHVGFLLQPLGDAVHELFKGATRIAVARGPQEVGLVGPAVRVDLIEPRAVQPCACVDYVGVGFVWSA
jgi:hypothetical protein